MANEYSAAEARYRYKQHCIQARELLEEELFQTLRRRVHVLRIDEDILRRANREWYQHGERRVDWEWERQILAHLRTFGARTFSFALIDGDKLCGMVAARVSRRKRWISVTHLEGHPGDHPLKGKILPIVIQSLFIFRATICEHGKAHTVGIRLLRPIPKAEHYYNKAGYTTKHDGKKLKTVVIEEPQGE